jgi:hypothetical protein
LALSQTFKKLLCSALFVSSLINGLNGFNLLHLFLLTHSLLLPIFIFFDTCFFFFPVRNKTQRLKARKEKTLKKLPRVGDLITLAGGCLFSYLKQQLFIVFLFFNTSVLKCVIEFVLFQFQAPTIIIIKFNHEKGGRCTWATAF